MALPPTPVSVPPPAAMANQGPADSEVIRAIDDCYTEALDAKRWRLERNETNRQVFLGQQDFSYKVAGQSSEFLPKTSVAVQQFSSFFKRAMTQAGPDWYEITPPRASPLDGGQCKRLMTMFLDDCLLNDNVRGSVHNAIADGAILASTESLAIFKVHGNLVDEIRMREEGYRKGQIWKLRVDCIPFESYFPDPSGKGLYEIHESERDLWEVEERAKEGLYDEAAVAKLTESMRLDQEGDREEKGKGQSEYTPPKRRHKVVIREFWGTLLDGKGKVIMKNCFAAVGNERFVIRSPMLNPFWHGESPFVCGAVLRVPFSVHHKALFDEAADLNLALNELFNLLLDGGLASVWGITQLRRDYLEDPDQASDGIPQGECLVVSQNLPPGEKVLERVDDGKVPQDGFAMYEAINREFVQAALSNELRLGQLPGKEVRAAEVVTAEQSTSATLDGIAGDIERNIMVPLLRKSLFLVLQFLDHTPIEDLASAVGDQGVMSLLQMDAKARFATFSAASLRVRGLSAVLERARNFQKLMAFVQVVTTNPILLQAFFTKYDPAAVVAYMLKMLQLDPSDFARAGREEQSDMALEMQRLPIFQQLLSQRGEGQGGPNNPNMGGTQTGGSPIPAEVNQMVNPMTGMTGQE